MGYVCYILVLAIAEAEEKRHTCARPFQASVYIMSIYILFATCLHTISEEHRNIFFPNRSKEGREYMLNNNLIHHTYHNIGKQDIFRIPGVKGRADI